MSGRRQAVVTRQLRSERAAHMGADIIKQWGAKLPGIFATLP